MNDGPLPTPWVGVVKGVNSPVVELIVNSETVVEPVLATYRKCPVGSTAAAVGAEPGQLVIVELAQVENATPGTCVRLPPAWITNPETVLVAGFGTYRNLPEGSTATLDTPSLT